MANFYLFLINSFELFLFYLFILNFLIIGEEDFEPLNVFFRNTKKYHQKVQVVL